MIYLINKRGDFIHLKSVIITTALLACVCAGFLISNTIPVVQEIPEQSDEPVTVVVSRLTEEITIPCSGNLANKTYMDYRTITNTNSVQYQYIHSDNIIVDERGFLVTADGYIGVALGTYFGEIGTKYIITLDTGRTIKAVKVEVKADRDTCSHNVIAGSNDLIEFVVDTQTDFMQQNTYSNGLVFQGNFNNFEEFNGNIIKVERVIDGCWVVSNDTLQTISTKFHINSI